ncbi:hypothetical protein COX05_03130 [candidate division WWE3 bacterium CG22_combo_CG10-13_8_21_14_all_39_12]|uniref:Uncharacterized protein n=2 Tax=Katanobacteria TaxID=422282 RepID=A0A2M7X131_UNCKA|nr:MAG: hypothetical protein COX05_03130 [candidate division WWE3 bacterium CG22_combo_CG10-13_8_21_14_all_39_12]PJA39883.1 MAG: hypothetical protein CO179_04070 [candidate division WWE3 bacterium CG_4_9_14_3_um_filter_39_7]
MATLLEDIKTGSEWIVKGFEEFDITLDYSIESLREIDAFFDDQSTGGKPKENSLLGENLGGIIFSIGAYVGETFIKNNPGTQWVTDDKNPGNDMNSSIEFESGTLVWPMQKVIKRFENGPEDSIYFYGSQIISRESSPHGTS